MKKLLKFVFFLVAITALAFGIFYLVQSNQKTPIQIAVVTPNETDSDSIAMYNGVEQYFDGIKIQGHKVELVWKQDNGTLEDAKQVANEIAKDPNIVAVIGHLYSNTSIVAADIYKEKGIPVLSGTVSATALKDNDWFFSVIPRNDLVGPFLANYATNILEPKRTPETESETINTVIIYDKTDPYSLSLKDGFVLSYRGLGGKIKEYDLASNSNNPDQITSDMVPWSNSNSTGLIFIATQKDQAQELVIKLRRKGIQNKILGGDALSGDSFAELFKDVPEEQTHHGYFTDNIYASSPIIFDSANQTAQTFFSTYQDNYKNMHPTWVAASSYDAALVLEKALKNINLDQAVSEQRKQIHEYLKGINTPSLAIEGLNGDIYFSEKDRAVEKPIVVGVFSKGEFISAPIQYIPIPNPNLISNLDQDRVIMNGRHVHQARIVYTGIEFNEISGLDEASSTYDMDFYLWFRYQGDNDQGNIDPTDIQFLNAVKEEEITRDEMKATDDSNGWHYRLYRIKGTFKSTFDFGDYPFDQQKMNFSFRHTTLTRDNLIYVVDKVGMGDAVSIASLISDKVFNSGSDWKIDKRSASPPYLPSSIATNSSLGDPTLIGLNPETEYATFSAEIPITRDVLSFILRNLLPVFFTLILTYMSYFLPSEEFSTRVGFLSGSILTIAFFHLGVSSNLRVGYTVALDNAFYAFYAIIMIGLLITMVEWYVHTQWKGLEEDKEKEENGESEDHTEEIEHKKKLEATMLRVGKIFFPLSLILLTLAFVWKYNPSAIPALPPITDLFSKYSVAPTAAPPPNPLPAAESNKMVLTIGSWRVDDQEPMDKILKVFNASQSEIEAQFSPVVGNQYNDVLTLQLQSTGENLAPDLFFLSPAGGRVTNPEQDIFAKGYAYPLPDNDFQKQFAQADAGIWSYDGQVYAIPIFAVSHGIYYNKGIFKEAGIETPPKTWDELMTDVELIKAIEGKEYIPFANGFYTNDKQRIGDLLFTNMAPTFIGGPEGRNEYSNSTRCFNDENIVELFSAIQYVSQNMPDNRGTITHSQTIQLFGEGKAAMYFGGSFDINAIEKAIGKAIEEENPKFEWGVFAIPHPENKVTYVNYHIDSAVAINAKSPHTTEALEFLKWLASPEFAILSSEKLPGFYPLQNFPKTDNVNAHAWEFYKLKDLYPTDIRWSLPTNGLPTGPSLMQDAALDMMQGKRNADGEIITPDLAAKALQDGLAQWYEPAQKCIE